MKQDNFRFLVSLMIFLDHHVFRLCISVLAGPWISVIVFQIMNYGPSNKCPFISFNFGSFCFQFKLICSSFFLLFFHIFFKRGWFLTMSVVCLCILFSLNFGTQHPATNTSCSAFGYVFLAQFQHFFPSFLLVVILLHTKK